MRIFPCGLCHGEEFTEIHSRIDRHRERIHVVVCNGCGLSQLNPRRDEAEEREFYLSGRYRSPRVHQKRRTSKRWIERKNRIAAGLLDAISLHHALEGARLLDVGCGHGYLIRQARERGAEVRGVEPDPEAAERLRGEGFDVAHATFLEFARAAPGPFDIVTLSHVVEHVNEPIPFVRAAAALLAPEGVLGAEVPNVINQIETGRYPESAHSAHLYYHSERSLSALFEVSGLRVQAVSFGLGRKMVRAVGRPGPPRDLGELPLDDPMAIEAAIVRLRRRRVARTLRAAERLVKRALGRT